MRSAAALGHSNEFVHAGFQFYLTSPAVWVVLRPGTGALRKAV
jgi:hypothetical protein